VSIMLEQLKLIYNNAAEVEGYRSERAKKATRKTKPPIEELSKLIQVIAKNNDLCLVAEKIADTYLMIEILKTTYHNAKKVEGYRKYKLERLNYRLLNLESQIENEGGECIGANG